MCLCGPEQFTAFKIFLFKHSVQFRVSNIAPVSRNSSPSVVSVFLSSRMLVVTVENGFFTCQSIHQIENYFMFS